MLETGYQNKIIKAIEGIGGVAINGTYSKTGEADLQCGYPVTTKTVTSLDYVIDTVQLVHVAVEVKTEKDYYRVMKCITEDYHLNGKVGLKDHEPLQMAKIRRNRKLGGLALVAWNFEQVKEYVDENKN